MDKLWSSAKALVDKFFGDQLPEELLQVRKVSVV